MSSAFFLLFELARRQKNFSISNSRVRLEEQAELCTLDDVDDSGVWVGMQIYHHLWRVFPFYKCGELGRNGFVLERLEKSLIKSLKGLLFRHCNYLTRPSNNQER